MLTDSAMLEKGIIYPLSVLGIDICLRSMEVLEKLNSLRGIVDNTHPPYSIRRAALNRYTVRKNTDYFSSIDYIFDFLLIDFDYIANGAVERFNEKKPNKEELISYLKECI